MPSLNSPKFGVESDVMNAVDFKRGQPRSDRNILVPKNLKPIRVFCDEWDQVVGDNVASS